MIEVPFTRVQPFAGQARRDGVYVADTRNTRWFWSSVGDGFAAIMQVREGVARLKGAWVAPEWRGRGVGLELTNGRLELLEGTPVVETFSWHPEFFERLGFVRVGTIASGAVKLRRSR